MLGGSMTGAHSVRNAAILVVAAGVAAGSAITAPGGVARAAPIAVVDGEALDVSAEHLEVDVSRGTALLRGSVVASFGDVEIRCPTVEIRYDRSPRVSFARGTGGVTVRIKGIEAAAETLEFDAGARKVALSGGVRLSQGRGWARAERASFDISSGKVSLEDVKGSIPIDAPKR